MDEAIGILKTLSREGSSAHAKRHLRARSFADVGTTKLRVGGNNTCGWLPSPLRLA